MQLTDHDLKQLDKEKLDSLPEESLRSLSAKLLTDLKEAREQLGQNPQNSSRPSGAMPPWFSNDTDKDEANEEESDSSDANEPMLKESESAQHDSDDPDPSKDTPSDAEDKTTEPTGKDEPPPRNPGRQPGSQGYGRQQVLPTDKIEHHFVDHCHCCGKKMNETEFQSQAYTAYYEIDILIQTDSRAGLTLQQTKHMCYESQCSCGHTSQYRPFVEEANETWQVAIKERHLVGPTLASMIIFLAVRMRLSRRRVVEFFQTWFGLKLSVGLIQQTITEGARCLEPVEEEIIESVVKSELLHIDETSWPQAAQKLWLWVVVGMSATWYTIGTRGRSAIERILFSDRFDGWLMSDGWHIYREYYKRLRCLAHLERKAIGLAQSLDPDAAKFGKKAVEFLEWVRKLSSNLRPVVKKIKL
ncbi:IS66 family transposase [Ectothiorhodospiraceae bacterium BW-2]|nr:IS66 family transposase [Ectothiorhodospiraceae bacterium BW-2]